jgi:hypothetical protein
VASAQTWSGGRQGPALSELFAIDKTGEASWPHGAEDIFGDGAGTFAGQEQSVDARTAYAVTDNQRFRARTYVSAAGAPANSLSVYVFIDTDRSASTGGSAAATVIDPLLTGDPTNGGYEFVLGVGADESVLGVWEFGTDWTPVNLPGNPAAAEAGTFLDPIRLNGDNHGYVQGEVDLDVVGLTQACNANLYVRTTNPNPSGADLDVGQLAPCVSADANDNNVPDVLEQPGCTTDEQCVNGGVCVNGTCVYATACQGPADCPNGYTCTDGRCVVTPSGTCTTTEDCENGLVCSNGQCVACTDGTCASGYVCGPDGRCLNPSGVGGEGGSGLTIGPEDEIEGGACACSTPGPSARFAFALLLLPLLLLLRRSSSR